jgi:dynein heavy chain
MKGNKKQVLLFFESNATLMSNQIRGLVTDTLTYYRDFFRRFKTLNHKHPAKIIEMEKNPRGGIEDVFLIVKLRDDEVEGIIQFADGLDFVKNELLRIVRDIVETSHNFGRPEYNNNARGDKQMLTKVPLDDQIVNEVAEEIEMVLDSNLDNISNVLQIYDEYGFLLV